jgi:hypothetical protein
MQTWVLEGVDIQLMEALYIVQCFIGRCHLKAFMVGLYLKLDFSNDLARGFGCCEDRVKSEAVTSKTIFYMTSRSSYTLKV